MVALWWSQKLQTPSGPRACGSKTRWMSFSPSSTTVTKSSVYFPSFGWLDDCSPCCPSNRVDINDYSRMPNYRPELPCLLLGLGIDLGCHGMKAQGAAWGGEGGMQVSSKEESTEKLEKQVVHGEAWHSPTCQWGPRHSPGPDWNSLGSRSHQVT